MKKIDWLLVQFRVGQFFCRCGIHKWDVVSEHPHGYEGKVRIKWACRYCDIVKYTETFREY